MQSSCTLHIYLKIMLYIFQIEGKFFEENEPDLEEWKVYKEFLYDDVIIICLLEKWSETIIRTRFLWKSYYEKNILKMCKIIVRMKKNRSCTYCLWINERMKNIFRWIFMKNYWDTKFLGKFLWKKVIFHEINFFLRI